MKLFMIAAPASGSGKTMITCGMLKLLKEKGVAAFKCGPDYIDPMFHRKVLGVDSENLDTYLQTPEQIAAILSGHEEAYGLIEGVMGLYDGLGGIKEEGSSYHLAKMFHIPILLVLDARGMGRTMISILKGICAEDRMHLISGIILNRTSKSFYELMKPLIEEEVGIPVCGYLPVLPNLKIESRHLGLQLPDEIQLLQLQLDRLAEEMRDRINFLPYAKEPVLGKIIATKNRTGGKPLTLAVARDEAFCFYYKQNLKELEQRNIKPVEFSPLHDSSLPKCDGLLLGGGYPELYAKALSENRAMCDSIQSAIEHGLPSMAECGGFMYLHRFLRDMDGTEYPMVGAIDGTVFNTGKLCRFGYVEIVDRNNRFGTVKGHEFHYYDSTNNGEDAVAKKPVGKRTWPCMHIAENHIWGFPHLYYPSCPELVDYFVEQMEQYHEKFVSLF